MNCTLCGSASCQQWFHDGHRSYIRCDSCGLVFVPPQDHISVEAEKNRYKLHDNTGDHEGYVGFLEDVASLVVKRCRKADRILDYGSGPLAVLTELLQNRGYDCTAYDPLYAIGTGAMAESYDMVILCEVIEHLRDVKTEIERIAAVMNSSAQVLIRTKLYPPAQRFGTWWYKNDCTHVNFFCRSAIEFVAKKLTRSTVVEQTKDIFMLCQ